MPSIRGPVQRGAIASIEIKNAASSWNRNEPGWAATWAIGKVLGTVFLHLVPVEKVAATYSSDAVGSYDST